MLVNLGTILFEIEKRLIFTLLNYLYPLLIEQKQMGVVALLPLLLTVWHQLEMELHAKQKLQSTFCLFWST